MPPFREIFADQVSKNFPLGLLWPNSPSAGVYKLSPSGEVFRHCSRFITNLLKIR